MSVTTDDREVGAGDHVVHFYDDADDLSQIVGPYLNAGLEAGARAVVIATREHRDAFASVLETLGVDVRRAQERGNLLSLDAEEYLERLLVDGNIDLEAFQHAVGEVIRRAADGGRHLRVYGELVDLLWDRGDVAQAIDLEQLWNELIAEVGFPLLCAYRSSGVSEAANEDAVRRVCHLHSSITSSMPTAASAPGASGSAREVFREFRRDIRTPRAARVFLDDVLHGWGHVAIPEDARLVLSELVTNAVIHARSPFSVSVGAGDSTVRLAVHDQSPAQPSMSEPDPLTPSGRGLQLISALSSAWGVERRPPGKVIWAEVPLD